MLNEATNAYARLSQPEARLLAQFATHSGRRVPEARLLAQFATHSGRRVPEARLLTQYATHSGRRVPQARLLTLFVTHSGRRVLFIIVHIQHAIEQLRVALLHLLLISQGIIRGDQIQTGLEVWLLLHNVLKAGASLAVLAHLYKHEADVVHDADPEHGGQSQTQVK